MTQSGQGEEPSARPAREGIVLPSDGGAPLLPGDLPPAPVPVQPQSPVQRWEQQQSWGPEPSALPAQPPAAPADAWNSAPMPGWGDQGHQGQQSHQGQQGHQGHQGHQGYDGYQGAPMPPDAAYGGVGGYGQASAPPPPVAGEVTLPPAAVPSAPLPPVADEAATQYIPPVPSMDEGATQFIPPVMTGAPMAEAATQFLPPVGPGALPPEAASDATTYLGRVPGGSGPLPPTAGAVHPDAQATQYIPPVPAGSAQPSFGAPQARQEPDVFDSLFRSEPGAAGPAGATRQMPRVQPGPTVNTAPQGPPSGGRAAARHESGGGGGRRTRSRVPVIAAVGIGIAVLGIGAGALMSGGSKDDRKSEDAPVSATGPAPEKSASEAVDPAKEQAVALDKLLADSGDSRAAVVKAVANIKACNELGQAATDLRDAAGQRGELVTKLGGLSVDKLPDHAALTTALTNAWKASASADNHYAAWADQVAGKKGCRKGQARTTGQTLAGNKASTTASAQKAKAAQLWNAIAAKYGLTERQAGQL